MPVAARDTQSSAQSARASTSPAGAYASAVSCGRIATIFTWPNASGPDGALRRFGTGRKGDFDFERV